MFNSLNLDHILILLLQTVIIAGLLLTLFRLRTIFGLALLFTALGVFQFIQVFLSSTIYFEVANNLYVSPGNIIFTGSLFAILLIYIREDAIEARKVIYAIIAANLVMSFMQTIISWGIDHEDVKNIYNLPIELFRQQSRIVIVGTLVLFLDVFAVIFLYETIAKYVNPLYFRILFTMLLVLTLDTLLFSFGVFIGSDMFLGNLYAGFITKYAAAIIYTALFTFYLKYIDIPKFSLETKSDTFKDIFYQLTYKQKFKQVSEEKIALFEKLQESKIQFSTFFENDLSIIYIISSEGLLTSVNPAFEKLTGWSVSKFINKPFEQIVHPDDRHLAQASIKNCIDEKEVRVIELRFLCKSGAYIYGEFTPILYKENHKNLGVLGKVMDITERKRVENNLIKSKLEFQTLAESMPQIVWATRADGWNIYFNQQWMDYTGMTLEESYGHGWNKPFHPDDQQKAWDAWQNAVNNNGIYSIEARLRRLDGEYFWWLVRGVPQINENGEIVKWFGTCTDIDAIKQTEKKLQESEELLRLSSELANVAAWEYNFETDEMSRSKNHDSLYGLPIQDKWEFATFTNATHPNDREMSALIIQNAVAVGGPDEYKFDFRVVYPNQSIHWLNVKGKVVKRNQKGQGVLVRGFLIDITDRKQAEDALIEVHNKLQTAIESMTDAVFISDIDGNFIDFNEAFATFHKFKNKDECSKTLSEYPDILEIYLPNNEIAPIEMWAVPRALRGEKVNNAIYNLRRKDTGKSWVGSYSFGPIRDNDGKIIGSVVVGRDITEQKQIENKLIESEKRYHTLFENMTSGFVLFEVVQNDQGIPIDLIIVTANKGFETTTGLNLRESIGKQLTIALPGIEKDPADWIGTYAKVALTGESIQFEQESELLNIYYSITAYQAEVNQCAVLFDDVSERKLAEKELNKYRHHLEDIIEERTLALAKSKEALLNLVDDLNLKQTQLEISNQKLAEINTEMETFTYSVSHDLKAPLRGIDGYSNLLQELYANELNDEAKTFVNNIRNGTRQMNQIIEDLLAYSRLDRTLISVTNININQFAKHIIQLYQKELSDFKFEVDNQIPNTIIVADIDALSIAFRNIFENAIKFTKLVENPKITILLEDKLESWHLLISDNGIGFDMKYYDKVFQIFQRLHRVEEYPGTGIGLAMVQKALQRMGGDVWASSELGKGTTFYMEIPKIKT